MLPVTALTQTGDGSAHILIVDDEPEIVHSLGEYLRRTEGYRVTAAYDGETAIELLVASLEDPADAIDLVVTDMWMPDVDGLQVLAWLREHPTLRYTRVVMLTAASSNRDKITALSAGADDYIVKPYYPQELLARVKTILRTQQLEKQLSLQSQQLAELNRVSQSVAAALDAGPVLVAAVEGVDAVLDAAAGAVYMHQPGENRLVCHHAYGAPANAFPPVPAGEGVVGRAFAGLQLLAFDDPPEDGRFQPELDGPAGLEVTSMIAAPLLVRGRAVGVLTALNRRNGRFAEVDRDLFTSLTRTISRAIENAWLFQRVQQRQQELLASRNTLHAVIDGILHPIYTISENYEVAAVNRTRAQQLPLAIDEIIGRTCYRVFYDRERPCDHCQVARTLANQAPQSWSVRWLGPDQRPREWDVNAYPIPVSLSEAARAVVVWQDRTEERRLEQSLLQAGKLAAIGQLAAGVAHEINNPLTAINANAEMLQMTLTPDDPDYEAVELIARAGERAAKVVRQLLDFARQEQYTLEPGSVNSSITQALSLVAYQLRSANIEVDQRLTRDLPELTASWEHLKSVWINLVINARDAVLKRAEQRRIEIVTRLSPDGRTVEVLFADNGIGIDPAEQPHIFEPFYTTKDPGEGTGLGLATCQRIVQQHGGTIEVVSEPGEGTTFIVHLPVHDD